MDSLSLGLRQTTFGYPRSSNPSDSLVSWPRGLGNGLQNRVQRFESARDLKKALLFGRAFLYTADRREQV